MKKNVLLLLGGQARGAEGTHMQAYAFPWTSGARNPNNNNNNNRKNWKTYFFKLLLGILSVLRETCHVHSSAEPDLK